MLGPIILSASGRCPTVLHGYNAYKILGDNLPAELCPTTQPADSFMSSRHSRVSTLNYELQRVQAPLVTALLLADCIPTSTVSYMFAVLLSSPLQKMPNPIGLEIYFVHLNSVEFVLATDETTVIVTASTKIANKNCSMTFA